jgi:hypothetical protein
MIKYKVNPKYQEAFTPFLKDIQEHFSKSDQSIHKARNELKIIKEQERELVVKAFKVPNAINQFAYAYLRGSKAKKSYENAMKLMELKVNTPEPIGYIEFHKNGLLKESFFVSLNQPHAFLIREPLYEEDFIDRVNIIEQFAEFTYALHQKNIFHKDYSAGNTLVIPKKNGEYDFSIVDINRMEFREIDLDLAMKNFNKLWGNEPTLTIIAKAYAKVANIDETEAIELILKHDKELKHFVERRRAFKAFFKGKK